MLSRLEILLDPLSPAQKTGLIGKPLILGTGNQMRLLLVHLPSDLEITETETITPPRYRNGSRFYTDDRPKEMSWKIKIKGATGSLAIEVINMLQLALQNEAVLGNDATLTLRDYGEPSGVVDRQVFLTEWVIPQGAFWGQFGLRYTQEGELTLATGSL